MTLRQAIGNAGRLHEFLEELLDQEDAVVLLFDGHRAINHVNGFGLSPCQLELLALEIERAVRTVGVKETVMLHANRTAQAIDEALAGTFPASDPPPWTPGLARPAPEPDSEATEPDTSQPDTHDVQG